MSSLATASPLDEPFSPDPSKIAVPQSVNSEPATDLAKRAMSIRLRSVRMVASAGASHIGSALSIVDILTVLYFQVLRYPGERGHQNRDRCILSKGHAVVGLYSTLCEIGILSEAEIDTYGEPGSALMAHASHHVPGVEFSTGSLGHGLPFAVGKALAARIQGESWRCFVILSDGELDEGSNWEALLFAAHHKLGSVTAIVDANGLQSLGTVTSTVNLEPLAAKFEAFGCDVVELDGHDRCALLAALSTTSDRPRVIIARTVKGKGVSFMENAVGWHYKSPNPEQLAMAEQELSRA
jgi:transketolase